MTALVNNIPKQFVGSLSHSNFALVKYIVQTHFTEVKYILV